MTAQVSSPMPATDRAVVVARAGSRQRTAGSLAKKVLLPVVVLAAIIGLWQACTLIFHVPVYLVPSPSRVWHSMVDNRTVLFGNAGPTIYEAGLGFLVGNAVGILLAILFVHSDFAQRALFPIAVFAKTVPIIAVAPLLIIFFGYGTTPKMIIAGLICFFPTLVNMISGLRAVDPMLLELMNVLSARRREIFLRVRWFSALPYLFSALKIAATNCVLGAVVAEWVGSRSGLGYLIVQTTMNYQTPLLYATLVTTSLIALLGYLAVVSAETLSSRWSPTTSAHG
ncbi:MAG: ABC transporter permease [Actinomycetes bacterium]